VNNIVVGLLLIVRIEECIALNVEKFDDFALNVEKFDD
jgi:hypothetical protein